MREIEWEIGADLYASVLVDPALPIRMTFQFFPKERANETTAKGRIGDLRTDNDIVLIRRDEVLEADAEPYLTLVARLVPGRPAQNSYSFDLVFFDQDNKDAYDTGTPLESLEFLSDVPFKDTFTSPFLIIDEPLAISYFEWMSA